jgi:hypothetical protein
MTLLPHLQDLIPGTVFLRCIHQSSHVLRRRLAAHGRNPKRGKDGGRDNPQSLSSPWRPHPPDVQWPGVPTGRRCPSAHSWNRKFHVALTISTCQSNSRIFAPVDDMSAMMGSVAPQICMAPGNAVVLYLPSQGHFMFQSELAIHIRMDEIRTGIRISNAGGMGASVLLRLGKSQARFPAPIQRVPDHLRIFGNQFHHQVFGAPKKAEQVRKGLDLNDP